MRLSTIVINVFNVVMLSIVASLSASCSREPSTENPTASTTKESIQADTKPKPPSEPPKELYPYHPVISDYLNKIEAELAVENAKIAKNNADDFQYSLSSYDIFIADLNGDKLGDVVLSFYTCEVTNCHNTTGSNDIAVFLNKGNTYEFVAAKSLGMTVENIASFHDYEKNVVMLQVDTLNFGDSDPTCCPSLKTSQKYKLSGKELVLVK